MKKIIKNFFGLFDLDIKKKSGKTEFHWFNQQYLEKTEFKYILWLDRAYQKIANVPGHVVELGVAYGRNAILFSHLIHMNNEEDVRKYFGFDTFDGYTEESLLTEKHLSKKVWKSISMDKVRKRISRAGDFKNIELFKGDILKTVPEFTDKYPNLRIALLYIDCNAYLPSIKGMEMLKEFMSPGGIICIDEKRQGGETKALIEFCKNNNLQFMRDNSPFSLPAYTKVP